MQNAPVRPFLLPRGLAGCVCDPQLGSFLLSLFNATLIGKASCVNATAHLPGGLFGT